MIKQIKIWKLKNNMVLGIDEFLPVEKQNLSVEFVGFKSFIKEYIKRQDVSIKIGLMK